ncbi:MAG: RNA polymerase sigma-54 factor, partial [bacterium]|nr:RNA polymerase sigma-54 factor [bacterium]
AGGWFIRAIHQRRKTIEKVTRSIFERQRDFLTDGASGLKPLTMDEVAEDIEMHVSTVSRAVADKIVETPRGLLPLKFFFTGGLPGDGGEVATEKVKSLIREIVAGEDTAKPLSDDAIVEKLNGEGVELARRTVAKYRKELKIPSKYERKKYI